MSEAIDLSEVVRDGEPVSREDLAALMGEQAAPEPEGPQIDPELIKACAGGLRVITIPAVIHLRKSEYDQVFVADNFRAWGYTPFGIFAVGHWANDEETERYMHFNGDEVVGIELQYEAYEEAVDEANSTSDESEEDSSGDDAAESSSD